VPSYHLGRGAGVTRTEPCAPAEELSLIRQFKSVISLVTGLPCCIWCLGVWRNAVTGAAGVIQTVPSRLVVWPLLELTVVLLSGEREVGTEGKILLLAREDKKLQGVGLQSRQPVRSPRLSQVLDWERALRCC